MNRIVSERLYQTWASWHVIFEWEDIMCQYFGTDLELLHNDVMSRLKNKYLYPHFVFKHDLLNWRLAFILTPSKSKRYMCKNVIPIYLDVSEKDISKIVYETQYLPCYFVTSLDIFNLIKKNDISSKCHYLPLSVSDKYLSENIPNKSIDVLQLGRKNTVLHEYMLKYCEEFPKTNYIYQLSNGNLNYESTIYGNIGEFSDRHEFIELLSRSKISLVSTPGCDNSRKFGDGIDFITPRFYESAAHYCYMLGRYTNNEEAKELEIESICANIYSYNQFKKLVYEFLNTENFDKYVQYRLFNEKNTTKKRAEEIYNVLIETGFKMNMN